MNPILYKNTRNFLIHVLKRQKTSSSNSKLLDYPIKIGTKFVFLVDEKLEKKMYNTVFEDKVIPLTVLSNSIKKLDILLEKFKEKETNLDNYKDNH